MPTSLCYFWSMVCLKRFQ